MVLYLVMFTLDLIIRMLCIDEENRFDIDHVMDHLWLRHYFGEKKQEIKTQINKPIITQSNTNSFHNNHAEFIAVLEDKN